MKIMGFSLALLMIIAPLSIHAQLDWIGIYADEGAEICDSPLPLFETVIVYILAHVPGYPEGIRAAEFRVENYPESGPLGEINEFWTSVYVLGHPGDDYVAIAWPLPQIPDGNGNVLIATLELFALDPDWIGENYLMWVANSIPADDILIVDHKFMMYSVMGDNFTFNCVGSCPCLYGTTASEGVSWSSLKALY